MEREPNIHKLKIRRIKRIELLDWKTKNKNNDSDGSKNCNNKSLD